MFRCRWVAATLVWLSISWAATICVGVSGISGGAATQRQSKVLQSVEQLHVGLLTDGAAGTASAGLVRGGGVADIRQQS